MHNSTGRTRWLVPALAALVVLLVGCNDSSSDSTTTTTTSCDGPRLTVTTGSAATGDTDDGDGATGSAGGAVEVSEGSITVTGAGFGAECGDAPIEGVRLLLVQGDQEISLAQVDADEELAFAVVVGLPESVTFGPAEIVAQPSLDEDAEVLASAELVIVES